MSLINDLSWRYAAKAMTGAKVTQEKIEALLDAIQLSASGFGLQPYQLILIENPALQAQIQPIAYGQPQITQASHVLVFAAWNTVTEERIDAFIQLVSTTRNVPIDKLASYRGAIAGSLLAKPQEVQASWAARQVYLAMGTALAAAAELQIDSTPMEGFIPAKLDELLDLEAKGLHSVLMLALGERDSAKDFMASAAKVRTPKDQLVTRL